jgi:hypothetical protein
MKNCPAEISGPKGPWYKRVNELVRQAHELDTAAQLTDLLGEPDSTYQDGGVRVLEYIHPYKTGITFAFRFNQATEGASNPSPATAPRVFLLDNIVTRNEATSRPDSKDVDALEEELGIRFPPGYKDFIVLFGEGTLSDTVRIYSPTRIRRELQQVRERWNQYYFWEAGSAVLVKAQVLASTIFADTVDGDELIVAANADNGIYVLPRHAENIFFAGSDLSSALGWLFWGGQIYAEGIDDLYFDAIRD